jgi:hypothetical protein
MQQNKSISSSEECNLHSLLSQFALPHSGLIWELYDSVGKEQHVPICYEVVIYCPSVSG